MGGVQWGSAADQQNVYVALSDLGRVMLTYTQFTDADRKRGGGMFALRLTDGARVWHTPPAPCDSRPRCSPAQSGAVSAMPGRGVFRVARRPHPRLRERHGQGRVGLRHRARVRDGERGAGARRLARRSRPGHRGRHDVRELGIHGGWRYAGQRGPRVFGRRAVIRTSHVGNAPASGGGASRDQGAVGEELDGRWTTCAHGCGSRGGAGRDRLRSLPVRQAGSSQQAPNPAQQKYPYPVVRDLRGVVPPGPKPLPSPPLGAVRGRTRRPRRRDPCVGGDEGLLASIRFRVPA